VHQVFHDMVRAHVGQGHDEYPDDPESINFIAYDFGSLLVHDTDQPFFADRIFANRLMNGSKASAAAPSRTRSTSSTARPAAASRSS
jgi:hypothetical protein